MVPHPRGSYIVHPSLSLEVAPPGRNTSSLHLSSMCESASQAFRGRMRLALHATRRTHHPAPRLVQAMSPWSVKTRRAPHCSMPPQYIICIHMHLFFKPTLCKGEGPDHLRIAVVSPFQGTPRQRKNILKHFCARFLPSLDRKEPEPNLTRDVGRTGTPPV